MKKPQLQVYGSLTTTLSIGWPREDLPVIHVFVQAEPGKPFWPSNGRGGPHWPCKVCKEHGYTKKDFYEQMAVIMDKERLEVSCEHKKKSSTKSSSNKKN
jgi:hypothetical protein